MFYSQGQSESSPTGIKACNSGLAGYYKKKFRLPEGQVTYSTHQHRFQIPHTKTSVWMIFLHLLDNRIQRVDHGGHFNKKLSELLKLWGRLISHCNIMKQYWIPIKGDGLLFCCTIKGYHHIISILKNFHVWTSTNEKKFET